MDHAWCYIELLMEQDNVRIDDRIRCMYHEHDTQSLRFDRWDHVDGTSDSGDPGESPRCRLQSVPRNHGRRGIARNELPRCYLDQWRDVDQSNDAERLRKCDHQCDHVVAWSRPLVRHDEHGRADGHVDGCALVDHAR